MRGFVISWFFPPMNSSEGLVTFKLLKESQNRYDVFTQKTCKSWSYGNTEKKLQSKNIKPIYSKKETYEEWIEEGLEYFTENQDKYDFIMSRATPKESHLLALKIKERFPNVKWIASFGDPLCNSPYEMVLENINPYSLKGRTWKNTSKKYIISPKRIAKNFLWKYKNRENQEVLYHKQKAFHIETNTIKSADIIIFNNKFQKKYMLRNYPEQYNYKSIIVNHSFDKEFYVETKQEKKKKINISFLGHLDEIRNAYVFLQAINNLKKKQDKISELLEVSFYGNMSDSDKLFIINNELYDLVKVRKPVDYFTSLKIMKESDWLLLIDADLSKVIDYNVYFAAKLADYIGADSKIMAITMENGASSEIVKRVGGLVLPHDPIKIEEVLLKAIKQEIKYQKNVKEIDKFDNQNVAKLFDKEIEKRFKGE